MMNFNNELNNELNNFDLPTDYQTIPFESETWVEDLATVAATRNLDSFEMSGSGLDRFEVVAELINTSERKTH